MRWTLFAVIFLLVGAGASEAQTYELRVYNPAAPTPFQTSTFSQSQVACGLPKAPSAQTNPTGIAWDDPNDPSRDCQIPLTDPSGPLLGLPIGNYEATLTICDSVGCSEETSRVPFARAGTSLVVTGFRMIKS